MQQHRFCRACLRTELPDPPPTDPCPRAGPDLVRLPAFGTQEPHGEEWWYWEVFRFGPHQEVHCKD